MAHETQTVLPKRASSLPTDPISSPWPWSTILWGAVGCLAIVATVLVLVWGF